MKKPIIILAAAFAFAACRVLPVWAQSDNPAWLEDVQNQLAEEKQCEVAFFVRVSEDRLGGRETWMARAQCVDGRQFDASKTEGDEKFAIKACQIEVC